jgi:restriction system protein
MRKDELETVTEAGSPQVKHGARGSVSYSIEVYHKGLHKHRLIRGPDNQVVAAKVRLQAAEWDELWAKKVAVARQTTMAYKAKEEAARRTAEAQAALRALREVLSSSLADSVGVD